MKKRLWIAVAISLSVTMIAALGLLLTGRNRPQEDVYGNMPAFHMIDQDGNPVTSDALKGKTLVFSFIYTTCPDICPMLTAKVRSLQAQMDQQGLLGPDVMMVSISVDPERDTPPVLKQYAEQYGADTRSWKFLTGDLAHVRQVVSEGFLTGMEKEVSHDHAGHGGTDNYTVSHSGKVVLVDKLGRIRAYHDSEDMDIPKLISSIKSLR